ncbi:muts domain V-domain-containing protein [Mycena amicta]|nr:muts domain V-domain-containing protein [Mycena amicta]
MAQAKISKFFTSPSKRGREQENDSPSKRRRTEEDATRKARAEQWKFTEQPSADSVPSTANSSSIRDVSAVCASDASDNESDPGFSKLSKFFNEASGKNAKGKSGKKAKSTEQLGPSGQPYTPLEKQILKLKEKYDAVLMVEVGYKYIFYGEDAKVAAKELGMVCHMERNFLCASIPVHRRDIHLKKLLSHGYKVGIVNQTETAALKKAGDNRNTVFERELSQLFTAATYVDELETVEESDQYSSPRLLCVIERDEGHIALISTFLSVPSSQFSLQDGEVVWDAFDDTPIRIELETRMAHLKPQELLIQRRGLSKYSEKMLHHFIAETSSSGARARTEYFDETFGFSQAFDYITAAYKCSFSIGFDSSLHSDTLLATITDLPKTVVVALACAIRHLSAFNIAASLLETRFFKRFTSKSHMLLGANTLSNLEIFQNETDMTVKGSLLSILDHTQTTFGKRMLKSWIGAPLIDKSTLQERIDAVEEIVTSSSPSLFTLRQILKKLPDLARGLCRIQYRQCTPAELVLLLQTFHKIGAAFPPSETAPDVGFKSPVLNSVVFALPPLQKPMQDLLDELNIKEAQNGRKDRMWKNTDKFPQLETQAMVLGAVEAEIEQELPRIRKTLKMPSLNYCTVAGEEYLVEVNAAGQKRIPDTWGIAVSKTKNVQRYRSPVVAEKIKEKARWEESLAIESKRAFLVFLEEVAQHYAIMRQAVQQLAIIDCLFSLAHVALSGDNYVKPTFVDGADVLEIVDGRHPMIEVLRADPFVPNSATCFQTLSAVSKSSSVRMIALIAIMAQIGSYCPASSVKLGLVDSVLTRMGASSSIERGKSTFMIELSETSEILHAATPRSLVILDELGRGTSTFDGMAIAHAVLEHVVTETRCKTLFITHYPLVAAELKKKFPQYIQNNHVGYRSEVRPDGRRDVTFLYRLEDGMAPDSFGVECARLAGLPEAILEEASKHSRSMERLVTTRTRQNVSHKRLQLLKDLLHSKAELATTLAALKAIS